MDELRSFSAQELYELLQLENKVTLIDVREVYEHDAYNIGGKLIVLNELMYHIAEIPKTGMVVLYCRKGVRSAIAIQRLQQKHGYENLYNLGGGIEKWIEFTNGHNVFI